MLKRCWSWVSLSPTPQEVLGRSLLLPGPQFRRLSSECGRFRWHIPGGLRLCEDDSPLGDAAAGIEDALHDDEVFLGTGAGSEGGWDLAPQLPPPVRDPRLGLTHLFAPSHPQTVHSWKGRGCQVRGSKLGNPGSIPSHPRASPLSQVPLQPEPAPPAAPPDPFSRSLTRPVSRLSPKDTGSSGMARPHALPKLCPILTPPVWAPPQILAPPIDPAVPLHCHLGSALHLTLPAVGTASCPVPSTRLGSGPLRPPSWNRPTPWPPP